MRLLVTGPASSDQTTSVTSTTTPTTSSRSTRSRTPGRPRTWRGFWTTRVTSSWRGT
jgi:hypothetical protein